MASAVRKWSNATSGRSGALSESIARTGRPSARDSKSRLREPLGATPASTPSQTITAKTNATPVSPRHHREALSRSRMKLTPIPPKSGIAMVSSSQGISAKVMLSLPRLRSVPALLPWAVRAGGHSRPCPGEVRGPGPLPPIKPREDANERLGNVTAKNRVEIAALQREAIDPGLESRWGERERSRRARQASTDRVFQVPVVLKQ